MLFRQAGIFHTNYDADRALFPIPGDRIMIGGLLALAILAPLYLNSLYLSSFILPWLVWTAATLGLNLIIGWAGQFHLGYLRDCARDALRSALGDRHRARRGYGGGDRRRVRVCIAACQRPLSRA
jgi:hypothetical protein